MPRQAVSLFLSVRILNISILSRTTPYSYQYTHHYPQAAYSHYSYVPQQPQVQRPQASIAPATAAATQPANANSGMDTSDVATLNDALGSAGVDLRAEEESLQRSHDSHQSYRTFEDRSRKQPTTPSFDTRFLGTTMRSIGTEHKVTKIPEDSVNYLAIALRARLQDLVTTMVAAANHRMDTQFDRPACPYENGTPMWSIVVQSDVAKQLAALEKIEREEEMKVRRERKERADMAAAHAANLAAQASGGNAMAVDGDEEGGTKKKKKKEGPGVTARNMSEDVRKKMSNAVASQAAGISSKYSWMNAANASTAAAKPKPAATSTATTSTATTTTPATTTAPAASTAPATSWARPYIGGKKGSPTSPQTGEDDDRMLITMRDAMFAVEKERGHGGGRGSARGWS
ncbi:transcription initiation factor TFIID component TAF4 family-domain-containing protein [Suillus plorans]|uniref:Transcription initiation factor TFIID subunit 4 n=1 Tax=Suillus plorans TaxID=116603 RepID=A0A9P7ABZ8_9AGAM|nr:transcription initiation factor TFIID component TAF4 family-domain-containing protein [Suillus plorans]KAG1786256.1 transcription initiation factor TFIID component TAF4 family-domain-containing protein [Suillus plorans]